MSVYTLIIDICTYFWYASCIPMYICYVLYWLLYVLIPCMEVYVNVCVCIYVCKKPHTSMYMHEAMIHFEGRVYCSDRRVIWDHYRLFHDPYEMLLGSMLGDLFRGIDRVGKGVWSQHNSVAVSKKRLWVHTGPVKRAFPEFLWETWIFVMELGHWLV